VGCVKEGRGGVQAGPRVVVRSPRTLPFPTYGACVRGGGSAITCGHIVIEVGVGLLYFSVIFLLPWGFGVPGYF
jgi:hypothetical protein